MKREQDRLQTQLLVLRCQSGEAAAIRELVAYWQPAFLNYARRLGMDDDSAWDVVQESWMAITKGLGRLRDPVVFPRWSMRIVHHKCVDRIRSEQRRRRTDETMLQNAETESQRSREGAGGCAGGLTDALQNLTPEQIALVHLKYVEEFSQAEISEVMGIPVGTVKSRLSAVLGRLRSTLEGES